MQVFSVLYTIRKPSSSLSQSNTTSRCSAAQRRGVRWWVHECPQASCSPGVQPRGGRVVGSGVRSPLFGLQVHVGPHFFQQQQLHC